MSFVRSDTSIMERRLETQECGQRQRFVRPPALLEENTYRLDFCPDNKKSPYAFIARHDQDALVHVAELHRIILPVSAIAFLIGWHSAGCWRLTRLVDNAQVYPVTC